MQKASTALVAVALLLVGLHGRSAAQDGAKTNPRSRKVPELIKARVNAAQQAHFPPSRRLDPPASNSFRVAAVQFGGHNIEELGERHGVEALGGLVRRAAKNGARLVVTPELALQGAPEQDPRVGTNVIDSSAYQPAGVIGSMGRLARSLGVTIVFHTSTLGNRLPPLGEAKAREHRAFKYDLNRLKPEDAKKLARFRELLLAEARRPRRERFDAALAVDGSGKVVANHHKFHSEWTMGTRGTSLEHSCFMTPAGKIGILVCADGQEALKKMPKNPRKPDKKLLKEFIDKPDLAAIAYPTMWMARGPGNMWRWKSVNQQSILAQVTRAWVIASNNNDALGVGGGIYRPDGTPVESSINDRPEIHYADLPVVSR
jgi:predicted amidohydrolase